MESWQKIVRNLFFIGLQIYLDIIVFGPIIDSSFESGVQIMIGQVDSLVIFAYMLIPNILGIYGFIDLIRELYELFK